MILTSLLSLVLSVASIFVGGGKGIALWCIGTLVLIISGGHLVELSHGWLAQHAPILLMTIGIQVVAILIGRWWGLMFHFIASIALTIALFLGALATMTVG